VPTVTARPDQLAPDTALPSRDVLLDAGAVREHLRILGRHAGARIPACTIARVNYQVGKSMRVVFKIMVDGEPHVVAARMFRAGKSGDAYARARHSVPAEGELRGIVWAPEIETVFWLFPNDRKIVALRAVLENARPFPSAVDPRAARAELVAYAPEKTATFAWTDREGRAVAYAKVAAAHQAERDYRRYETLRAMLGPGNSALGLPAPLAYSSEHRTLWLEALHGRRMAEPGEGEHLRDLRRLGAAIGAFHGLPPGDVAAFDRFAPGHLSADAALLGRVRPDLAEAADRLAARLISTAPPDGAAAACLHGDLHPKNAIVSGDRISLIDLEDVAAGPAAADLGSMLAALLYLRTAGRLSAAVYAASAGEFLAGYAAVRPLPDAASLAWYSAAALFMERAVRSVTRVRPLGLAHLGALLARAGRLLDRGGEVFT
jgi:aminoglycoside phosphotransferase (APT) family kinase protein